MAQPTIRVDRRPPSEFSEGQIAALMAFGVEEATILDKLEAATRRGDRERAWELCRELCDVSDEVQRMAS
jgi:hypothetical protein